MRLHHTAIIITCNESLMIGANIRHLYPHFDKIIVCDGPSANARGQAGGDGRRITGTKNHSTDGTVEAVAMIQEREDPLKKVVLLQKDRPWNGKLEKFNEALTLCSEGYVWQVDADEFLFDADIKKLKGLLEADQKVSEVAFFARHFWGDLEHHFEITAGQWGNVTPWTRIFRYHRGNRFYSHEPPLMMQQVQKKALSRDDTEKMGIYLFHFGYVHRSQLQRRERFYAIPGQILPEWDAWQLVRNLKVSGGNLLRYDGQYPIDIGLITPQQRKQEA